MSSTTLPSQLLGTVASAAGTGLDAASHLVAEATESFGDIAGAAIDVGGNAAGVIADSTVRGARKAWSVAPDAVAARQASPRPRRHRRGGPRDLLRARPPSAALRLRCVRRRRTNRSARGESSRRRISVCCDPLASHSPQRRPITRVAVSERPALLPPARMSGSFRVWPPDGATDPTYARARWDTWPRASHIEGVG